MQWSRWLAEVRERLHGEAGARLVKVTGDGFMAECADSGHAVRLAGALHELAAASADPAAELPAISLRIAVHVADVLDDGTDLYGHDANIAARAMALAAPGQTVLTEAVRDQLGAAPPFAALEDLGECHLKHVEHALRLFAVGAASPAARLPVEVPTLPRLVVIADSAAGGAEDAALASWLAESLTAELARSGQLCVISSLSAHESARHAGNTLRAAGALQAALLVVMRCRVIAQRTIVSWELAQTDDGSVLAGDALQVPTALLFAADSPPIEQIAGAVLTAANARVLSAAMLLPPENLDAYTLQAGAIALMHCASVKAFERGGELLNTLIERHPRMVGARSWLAKWHVLRVTRGLASDRRDEARQALALTKQALLRQPHDAMALAVEGFVFCHMLRDLAQARARLDEALDNCPNEPLAWLFSSVINAFEGRGQDAMHDAAQAQLRSPADPLQYYFCSLAATAALSACEHARALELATRSYAMNRLHASTVRVMAIAQVRLGMPEEAARSIKALLHLQPGLTARAYLEGFPAGANEVGRAWSEALHEAGLPA